MPRPELAHLELLAEVDAMVDRLNRWADSAPAWQPAERCRFLIRRLSERAASLRIRIDAPLVVATLGGSGAGKSALINALVGAEVVRTGRERPTTTRPTLVCRPNISPEMLGIDPASVEMVHKDLPSLRDMVLVDCPDPDTTEMDAGQADAGLANNLARLRAILPKCDVLLVAATQQKYRSARVSDELAAATCGAELVFVQTHADQDDDIRDDWRAVLPSPNQRGDDEPRLHPIFFIDSLRALADAKNNLQPRGEFADLLDLLTRQMSGAAANRIRRDNFLDLAADALDACRSRLDLYMPLVRELKAAVDQQRDVLAGQIAGQMQAELLGNRRQWENRLLAQTASRWGFSPFSLVLRTYQGLGGLLSGALLYRVRTPAQMALWGTFEGIRSWRRHRENRQAERGVDRTTAGGFDAAELRKAALIVDGYAAEAGLDRAGVQFACVADEAEAASGGFVAQVSGELESLIARLAKQHTGWFTRFFYEISLAAMLGVLLYRGGKNFFYDSWLSTHPLPVFGLDFYVSAGFWLLLWCLVLLWAFCGRLRRGLRGEIDRLAAGWRASTVAMTVFAHIEAEYRRVEEFRRQLNVIQRDLEPIDRLRSFRSQGAVQQ